MEREDSTDTRDEPLANLSDDELGRRVRSTPTFRLAVACEHFDQSARELRESSPEAWGQLITDTKQGQSSVTTRSSTEDVVEAFLDAIGKYGALGCDPSEAAAQAAEELADEEGA